MEEMIIEAHSRLFKMEFKLTEIRNDASCLERSVQRKFCKQYQGRSVLNDMGLTASQIQAMIMQQVESPESLQTASYGSIVFQYFSHHGKHKIRIKSVPTTQRTQVNQIEYGDIPRVPPQNTDIPEPCLNSTSINYSRLSSLKQSLSNLDRLWGQKMTKLGERFDQIYNQLEKVGSTILHTDRDGQKEHIRRVQRHLSLEEFDREVCTIKYEFLQFFDTVDYLFRQESCY